MLRDLFPPQVVTVQATEAMWDAPLRPEEAASLPGGTPRRRREFAAGRACAREALARLGLPDAPIPRGPDRAPEWPRDVVGSIAHCIGACAAAVALRRDVAGIGLDLEQAGRVRQAAFERISTPGEREEMNRLPAGKGRPDWAGLLFSAKESIYKCWQPLTGEHLGWRDAEVRFEPEAGRFQARLLTGAHPEPLTGRFVCTEALVCTGLVVLA